MKLKAIQPPREFNVGIEQEITIRHCADISLSPNEQVTFVGESGHEYDVARKSWGYYATPSINGRLRNHHLRGALVSNQKDQLYLMLVESGKEAEFNSYLDDERQTVLMWLDGDDVVAKLTETLQTKAP